MKIRNLLVGFVLAMMFLCGSFNTNAGQVSPCVLACGDERKACISACNGDPICEHICWSDYYCCRNACNNHPCF